VLSKNNIFEIIAICNQEDIYSLLFRDKLNGERYEEPNAQSFVAWANKGWQDGTYFVFIIKNQDDKVIGAIDIKSNNSDLAEIGYWASDNFPGFMTNAVSGLIEQAKNAGCHSFVAYTKLENNKSKGVLSRSGFDYVGQEERQKGIFRDKFILKVSN
jgi:RimJ/RimL family protein N-acetyltransferase